MQEFQLELESISAYLERVHLFFLTNDIGADKKVAVLLSVIGAKTYTLLRSLALPQDKSFDELQQHLKHHFEPEPLVVAERFRFHRRGQAADESIAEYLAELKRLTTHCKFGVFLDGPWIILSMDGRIAQRSHGSEKRLRRDDSEAPAGRTKIDT